MPQTRESDAHAGEQLNAVLIQLTEDPLAFTIMRAEGTVGELVSPATCVYIGKSGEFIGGYVLAQANRAKRFSRAVPHQGDTG